MTTRTQSLRNPLAELLQLDEAEKAARGLIHTPAEVAQQPETWEQTFELVKSQREALEKFLAENLPDSATVYLVGAGTSDYVGRALASVLRTRWKRDVIAVPSTELVTNMENYVVAGKPYLWISFSRSGDSSEGVGVLEMAQRSYPQVKHLVITCNKEGDMSRLCAGREDAFALVLDERVNDRGLAMTSSFTNMVLAGQCLANLGRFDAFHSTVNALAGMAKTYLPEAARVAEEVSKLGCRKVCFVGSGALAAVATECALKVLELTAGAIWTMAESTMGLRHGPMSALDDGSVIVSLISSDPRRRKYEIDLLKEMKTKRLGKVRIAIAPSADAELQELCEHVISLGAPVDFEDDYRAPVDVIFGQLLGLFSSLREGLQPDHPSPEGTISRVVSHVTIY